MSTTVGDNGVKDWNIQPQSEYRFEVDAKRPIGIKVRRLYAARVLI